jgi:hypothetical protein
VTFPVEGGIAMHVFEFGAHCCGWSLVLSIQHPPAAAEFGPNMTTFVMPSELYPVTMRATGHGISAGVGKFGAFVGVFLFPVLQRSLGLRGTLLLTAGVSVLGFALTLVLPEPSGRSLEDMPVSARDTGTLPLQVADQASAP